MTEEKYTCALSQSLIVYFYPVVSRQRPVVSYIAILNTHLKSAVINPRSLPLAALIHPKGSNHETISLFSNRHNHFCAGVRKQRDVVCRLMGNTLRCPGVRTLILHIQIAQRITQTHARGIV